MFFVPLEANPESFNPLASALGLDTSRFSLVDVLGLDEDLLALVPQPVEAVIMLFPTPERRWDDPTPKPGGGEAAGEVDEEGLVYFRQKLSNHCGTIALLHCLANTPSVLLRDGPIKNLFEKCRGLSPEESATLLAATDISTLHANAAQSGQSEVPRPEDDPGQHFIAFIAHRGQLIELDGYSRAGPISHGPINGDLFHSVVEVVKKIIIEQDSIRFSLMALTNAPVI